MGLGLRKKGGARIPLGESPAHTPALVPETAPPLPSPLPSPLPTLLPRALMSQAKVRLRVRTCSLSTVESDGGVVLLHLEEQPGEAVKEREGEVRENAIA